MEKAKDYARHLWENAFVFLRWCLFSVLIGVTIGIAGAMFHELLEWVGVKREAWGWPLYVLPVVGLVIAVMYQKADLPLERGTNFIFTSVRTNHPVRFRLAPLIVIGSALTHLCGGSAGREGAALQLGGSMGSTIGRLLRLDELDQRTITLCGMAAGFTALFGTPLAATMFALEVISVGVLYYAALLPCLLSALIARFVAAKMGCAATAFTLSGAAALDVAMLLRLLVFGVLCAMFAALICIVFHGVNGGMKKLLPNPYICIVVGGVLVIVLTLLCGTHDYNGTGMAVIERALAGQVRPEAFLLKLLFTAITIGVGYKGGEIVPVFFMGATFGCTVGGLLGLSPAFAAALGLCAVFCGVTNSPMTSLLLAFELFGGEAMPQFALVIATAYMLSGYYGLYAEQKIVYSKMRPKLIDRKTN